jgi:hypothetical protein
VRPKIADALYSIFVKELGADEFHRFSFVWSYCNMDFHDFTILCDGNREQAHYRRTPLGLGEVASALYEPQRLAANQAIRDLARWIVSIPPLERMAWVNGEIERA